jgi:hypothetical protein
LDYWPFKSWEADSGVSVLLLILILAALLDKEFQPPTDMPMPLNEGKSNSWDEPLVVIPMDPINDSHGFLPTIL